MCADEVVVGDMCADKTLRWLEKGALRNLAKLIVHLEKLRRRDHILLAWKDETRLDTQCL